MIDIATHLRIFDIDPSSDLVAKHSLAIKELAGRYARPRNFSQTLDTANDLALAVSKDGAMTPGFVAEVEAVIRKTAKGFMASDAHQEVMVCGLLGAVCSFEGAGLRTGVALQASDVFAVGLWSALAFQRPRPEARIEALRAELLSVAQAHILASATSARARVPVPDAGFRSPDEMTPAKMRGAMAAGVRPVVEALRANSEVDREELELLWWITADWSELLRQRFAGAPAAAGAIAAGIEAGRILRRMPADAHRHLVLRHVSSSEALSLAELLTALGECRHALAAGFEGSRVPSQCPAVFPLFTAIATGTARAADAAVTRSLREWSARALIESAALHVTARFGTGI